MGNEYRAGAVRSGRLLWIIPVIALLLPGPSLARTILVLGDSLSAGYGISAGRSWVELLAERLPGDEIVNASISGETSAGGRARLPALLARHHPDVVLIELGANDGLRGLPLRQLEDNLAAMIAQARHEGAKVLLFEIRIPPNYGRRYAGALRAIYRRLAERPGVRLVPFLLDGIATEPRLMQPDGLHPTAAAQPRIRDHVLPYLLKRSP